MEERPVEGQEGEKETRLLQSHSCKMTGSQAKGKGCKGGEEGLDSGNMVEVESQGL